MKKFFMFALAAVAMLSVTSCMNEKDMDLAPNQGKTESEAYGYISLNATTQNAVITRSVTTENGVTKLDGEDIENWYAKVHRTENDTEIYGWSDETNNNDFKKIGTTFATSAFAAKIWTVEVRNYKSEADAQTGFGDAYYEGPVTSVEVTAGNTATPTIACGKPKNTRLTIDGSGFGGTALSVATTSPRSLSFSGWTKNTPHFTTEHAYFTAEATVTYTITYTINKITKTTDAVNIIMGGAGTSKQLTITSNNNGTISLTITTEGFADPENLPITIDAATGNKL